MEKEKRKLNLKIVKPVIVAIIVTVVGIMFATNQNKESKETQAETVIEEKELHQIGETVVDDDLEITLKYFQFVDSVYDSNALKTYVGNLSNSKPSSDNALIEVNYTIKNVGKEARTLLITFGGVDYNDGYLFTADDPVGIHLVKSGKTVSIASIITSVQPLSEAVEVLAFLEVPKELKENTSAPLIYNCYNNVFYEIR